MTLTMTVPATEHGQARVFAVDLPPEEAQAWGTAETIAAALGTGSLPEGQWDYIPLASLEGLGLAGYLTEGMGLDPDQLKPDLARLSALRGHVLIVTSAAVRGRTLTPRAPLRWIGTYGEPVTIAPMDKLHSGAAAGAIDQRRKAPSDAAMSGRIAALAIAVLLFLVALMVWIAG